MDRKLTLQCIVEEAKNAYSRQFKDSTQLNFSVQGLLFAIVKSCCETETKAWISFLEGENDNSYRELLKKNYLFCGGKLPVDDLATFIKENQCIYEYSCFTLIKMFDAKTFLKGERPSYRIRRSIMGNNIVAGYKKLKVTLEGVKWKLRIFFPNEMKQIYFCRTKADKSEFEDFSESDDEIVPNIHSKESTEDKADEDMEYFRKLIKDIEQKKQSLEFRSDGINQQLRTAQVGYRTAELQKAAHVAIKEKLAVLERFVDTTSAQSLKDCFITLKQYFVTCQEKGVPDMEQKLKNACFHALQFSSESIASNTLDGKLEGPNIQENEGIVTKEMPVPTAGQFENPDKELSGENDVTAGISLTIPQTEPSMDIITFHVDPESMKIPGNDENNGNKSPSMNEVANN